MFLSYKKHQKQQKCDIVLNFFEWSWDDLFAVSDTFSSKLWDLRERKFIPDSHDENILIANRKCIEKSEYFWKFRLRIDRSSDILRFTMSFSNYFYINLLLMLSRMIDHVSIGNLIQPRSEFSETISTKRRKTFQSFHKNFARDIFR